MDEYDKKFAEMQKYIPFLEAMIERLQNVKDKSREVQLQKMQSLHGILSNSKRKLKIETLQRCEDVLQKLHNKVEKGNTPGMHLPNKKGDGNSAQLPTQSKNATSELSSVTSTTRDVENAKEKQKLHETPASPSPPVSPESGADIVPIIIPTERRDFHDEKSDSKPASPDEVEILPRKAPIIIPTERTGSTPSPSSNNSFQKNSEEMSFSEWDMLEECENTNAKSSSWHLHGKKNDELSVTSTIPRQVAVVPVPSPDGSRRVPLILDKGRLQGENTDARSCETKIDLSVNISDNRLTSPDSEHLILKHKSSSPRLKESHTIPKPALKPPAPLLLSPPPVSTAPPLSMEDLAELLSDSGDGKSEKKTDKPSEDSLSKKDTNKLETGASISTKDGKPTKTFLLTQDDLDRESERQWEEVHKHIVKFPSKKGSSNVYTVCSKSEMVKSCEGKGITTQAGSSAHSVASHKHHSLSPGSEMEPRYADNYERRPRHSRDSSIHESMKDKLSANSYCRLPEDELGIPPHHVSPTKADERLPLYQRRQSNIGPDMVPHRSDTEFRMDGPEFFGRQMPNAGHWSQMHGGVPNSNTWAPSGNYNIPNPPVQGVPYQHPMSMHQQEMWNVSSPMNPVHTEPHMMNEVPHRSNQFSPNMSMPLVSPNAHPSDINHVPRGDGMHDDGPILKPLMSPTNFPMGPQFHNFQGETRPYEQPFDRGMEYPHVRSSWESSGKGADTPFRGEGDVPCGVVGSVDAAASTSGSYPRSSTPCPWNRDRDSRCNRARGRDSYYNDRNRNETRTNFNRDARRPEWPGGGHSEWDSRFNRDSRSISERDPRIRMDHNVQAAATQNVAQPKDSGSSTAIRDPRLAKDKHSPSVKLKDSTYNDRDPRKRQVLSTSSSEKSQVLSPRKTKDEKSKDKPKSPKVSDGHRKSESESLSKAQQEKLAKEKAQSSLESLYGVIDTKTKTGQGLLQKFKIPKIKRSESQQLSSVNVTEKMEENKEDEDKPEKDDARVEVTSSSDGNIQEEDWGGDSACWLKGDTKEDASSPKCVEPTGMDEIKVGEADSAMDITSELSSTIETPAVKEDQAKTTKQKEEVTQEYIETLIKKSLESGEGKKLVEQAKLMQRLTEALEPKKLKRIKKILQSETESSSSEKEDDIELKKLRTRKKIRRIVSDSSEEECLADRLRSRNSTPVPEATNELTNIKENPTKTKHSNESVEKPAKNATNDTNTVQKDNVDLDSPENVSKINSNANVESKTDGEEIQQNEELNDEENALKPQKIKTKRRNSLEMLQEDIREMFICDDVVTATGYRVCRMQKENQSNTATAPNQPSCAVSKQDEPISKQDTNKISKQDTNKISKQDANKISKQDTNKVNKQDSIKVGKQDTNKVSKQETNKINKQDTKKIAKQDTNKITNTEPNKPRPRGRPRKPRNRAKRVIQSSDSEEDQPLALRAALIQSSLLLSNDEDTRDDIQFETRRRGKRGAKKESLKEPRVVIEKTEISKLESSKASFDSSSEEDFSIDVSKLTAAVDNSLLLEKHSDQEVSKTTEVSQERDSLNLSEKSEVHEDNLHMSGEGKVVEAESFSSGSNAGNTSASKTKSVERNFNEELLSNILVGLVPTKSDSAKNSSIDKGDEADVDEDTNDQQPSDQGTKKNITKKKKKKWRMGILSKKKKKRAHEPSSKIDADTLQTSSEMDISLKLDISSDVQDDESNDKLQKTVLNNAVPVDSESTKDSLRDGNAETDINSTNKVPTQQAVLDEQPSDTGQIKPQFETIFKKEPTGTNDKTESTEEKAPKENILRMENVDDKKAQELQAVYGTLREFKISQWTEYVLTGQDRYRCWICFFTGKNIVHHYKVQHPGAEILISRLNITEAKSAIKQAEDGETENSINKLSKDETRKFTCRICSFSAEGPRPHAMEAFYEHYTTHTGEYRFRCNFCPYQSVAKGSMRTHFYKLCRKFTRIFNDSITEDKIPEGFTIYGYLCSICNFFQLMKGNVEKHVSFWHPDVPDVKIIKINLAGVAPKQTTALVVDDVKTESVMIKKAEVDISLVESTDKHASGNVDDTNGEPEDMKPIIEYENPLKPNLDKTDTNYKANDSITDSIEVQKKSSYTSEDTLNSKKLNAFVCPPELENKEVEIQLERKKKMEKIIEDIGIKLNQGALKKGLSITDKLTNKMRSDLQPEETGTNELLPVLGSSLKDGSDSLILQPSALLPETILKDDFIESNTSTNKGAETKTQLQVEETSTSDSLTENSGKKIDLEPQSNSEVSENTEKSDVKVRDPLVSILNQKRDDESEIDNSDTDNARDSSLMYDYDSSSEQSESELSPDVNTLLKETSNISATSKAPMLTTIQRLAAQLQAAKSHGDSSTSESIQGALEKSSSDSISQSPMIPVTVSEIFDNQRENSPCKTGSSELQPNDENSVKCIRLRRLSGDMLSMSNDPEDSMTSRSDGDQTNAPIKVESLFHSDTDEECSFLKIENVVSLAPSANNSGAESPLISDIRKAVETSPIKLGVSVLKRSNCPLILKRASVALKNPTIQKNLPIVQQAPNETVKLIPLKTASPTMSKSPIATRGPCFIPIAPKARTVPIAPKSRPGETKLVSMDTGTLVMPRSVIKTTVAPVGNNRTMTLAHPSGQPMNYKIVKLIRPPNTLKPKETFNQTPAMKMKSIEAYNMMLTPTKLSQFYKCMSRDCSFTTDVLVSFFQHYQQHLAEVEKQKSGVVPYDFQRCAYCYQAQENWNQMKLHLEEKHEHCRYQCGFCFYRSLVLSYARVHQESAHPGSKRVILCKTIKDPRFVKDDPNRYEFILPYVCQHECNKIFYVPEAFVAHLKSKHVAVTPVYKCHLCSSTFAKIDQLLTHYKIHGYYKYQCLYCLTGADTSEELHSHLSMFHYNKIPQILERSLPARIIRGKDVIQQLIIRQFEESTGPEKCNDGAELAALSSPVQQNTQSAALKESTVLSQKENDPVKKPLQGILWQLGSQNGNSPKTTVTSAQLEKVQGTDGRKETISIRDILANEAKSQTTPIKLSEEVSQNVSSPKNVKSFISGGKIITVNLLNNSGIVTTVSPGVSDVTLNSNSKGDDSDVEILETIDKSESKSNKDETVLSTKEKPKPSISIKSEVDDTIDSSNPDTSTHLDADDDKALDKPAKMSKPLTLEDIKDTGFTGVKLYRCGYKSCTFSARNVSQLKTHVKQCPKRGQNINCIHCNKRFVKVGCLVEHLKLHGLKRFGCSLCSVRFSVSYQALAHMKTKHKVMGTKLVPADPTNPSANGLFIVQRWNDGCQRKRKRRKLADLDENEEHSEKGFDIEKSTFGPDEIEQLPRQAIYSREVQCAVCPYTTKVRTNIVRHLQLHAKDESVPESGPVNPVPCLDKKERMFDKMVNLASSSHQNGRMGGKPKEAIKNDDEEYLPKFVPEHKRYVCGVAECNYLTVDEAMLRYHLKALHSEEPYFRCPHCPQPVQGQDSLNIAIDKMGIHLKMHDARLYKCSHCNYHHYHRHVVERHLTDKHPEKRPFVKAIRELETSDNTQQSVQEEAEEEVPDPDGNHWKCNICDYKCVYKAEMITHASSDHDEKYQFKCTLCTFKTSGKILFEQHIISKHNNDPNVDFIMVYQRIKGVNKRNVESNEQGSQDEPFDTTPIWRRDMPRIRHIRGILLEEESNSAADASQKGVKRKSDAEVAGAKPAKLKPVKSGSLDESKQVKEKEKRSQSCEKMSSDTEHSNESADVHNTSSTSTPVTPLKPAKNESIDSPAVGEVAELKCGRFGPYGSPDGNLYVCTLCNQYKTKYKHDMRDHLYRELNYARWHCKECNHSSVNRNSLMKHCNNCHRNKAPKHEPLPQDRAIEFWVRTVLRIQTSLMKGIPIKQITDIIKNPPLTVTASENDDVKGVSLKSSVSGSDILNVDDTSNPETRDQKKNAAKKESSEDQSASKKAPVSSSSETAKPLTCKHCKMIFTRWRGFKLHVQLIHLKRLGFLCPYCDRSTNSETRMRQHIKAKHPGREEKIIENPAAGGPELSSEFWEKEYGVVFPMKSKKRKRDVSVEGTSTEKDNSDNKASRQEKCTECSFTALNFAGLKAHMRTHTVLKPILKCSQCTFTSPVRGELWDHWKINHPLLPFKHDTSSIPDASTSTSNAPKETPPVPDYNADIEEEVIPITPAEDDVAYSCFYCNFRNKSKDIIKAHWSMIHKNATLPNESSPTGVELPFRYKEVDAQSISTQRVRKTPPGSITLAKGADEMLFYDNNDIEVLEGSGLQDGGWICQWCNELCDGESKIKAHQNMFHSHLPLNFKRADGSEPPKGYCCCECPYTTTFVHLMRNHMAKHINLFKCKYCLRTFGAATHVAAHTAEEHPGLEVKITSIQNFDFLMEKLMGRVKWITWEEYIDKKFDQVASPNRHGVAKKSTAKSSILASPFYGKVKAVARKSMTSSPANLYHQSGSTPSASATESERNLTDTKEISYYGVPQPPVDLAQLNTYMVVGGMEVKVKCITLARLININPKVMVRDLKNDANYASLLSRLN